MLSKVKQWHIVLPTISAYENELVELFVFRSDTI